MRSLALLILLAQGVAGQQPPPTFRGGTVLVPIDVRVLDKAGDAVRDLTRDDFTVLEDGVVQQITQFSATDYTAPLPRRDDARAAAIDERRLPHRTLLIVLGRGRLQGPSRGFDAIESFIRTRLSPRDRLGLVAYDRVTDLTTDHASILRLLRVYRSAHEEIEALLDHWFSGLTAFFTRRDAPPGIQRKIDAIFTHPDAPPARHLVSLAAPGEGLSLIHISEPTRPY